MPQLAEVFGLRRLFDKVRSIVFHLAAKLDREGRRRLAVQVDTDIEVVADRFADGANPGHGIGKRPALAQDIVLRLEKAALARGPAVLFRREPEFAHFLGAVAPARLDVDAHAIPRFAAEQLPDRQVERFAEDVPERDVDRADRRHQDRPATIARAAKHRLPVPFDFGRVLADEVALVLEDRLAHGQPFRRQRSLAEARDALVRVDLDEDVVLVAARVHHERADIGDLQTQLARLRLVRGQRFVRNKGQGCSRGTNRGSDGLSEKLAALHVGHSRIGRSKVRRQWRQRHWVSI